MKQKMILTVCLAVLGMLSVKAQQSIIALHHQGNVTIFAGGELQEAIDASEKGDTLYLSDGIFSECNLKHGLVILGGGQETIVGGITISSEDSTEVKSGFVFSGMRVLNKFIIDSNIDGILIKHLNYDADGYTFDVKSGRTLRGGQIIQSRIVGEMRFYGLVYDLQVLNSCIWGPNGGGVKNGSVTFINCNVIVNWGAECGKNIFKNCFCKNTSNGTFINCSYNWDGDSEVRTYIGNHWYYSWSNYFGGSNHDCDLQIASNQFLTAEQIKELGWIGTDGTIIGCMGGSAPYTLEIDEPHVTSKNIVVDNDERKITVTLKVESGDNSESSQEGQ